MAAIPLWGEGVRQNNKIKAKSQQTHRPKSRITAILEKKLKKKGRWWNWFHWYIQTAQAYDPGVWPGSCRESYLLGNNTFSEEAIEKVQTVIITEVDESISNDTSESDTDNESDWIIEFEYLILNKDVILQNC